MAVKNLRVALPRDDAEDFIRKPSLNVFELREPRTLRARLDSSTSPRGLALNPIQAGFHPRERHRAANPFSQNKKNFIYREMVG